MDSDLFTGKLVRLAAMNAEADAEAFARWDRDSEYLRQLDGRPQLPNRAKKIKDDIEKEQSEDPNTIAFSVRTLADDRLIGFVAFDGINWQHGDTFVGIGIGDPAYRGNGYGTDAMRVLLRYGFEELNLQRISLDVFEYNERALKSYLKAGFVVEGRQRGMLRRAGYRWDFIYMGILREEWKTMNNDQLAMINDEGSGKSDWRGKGRMDINLLTGKLVRLAAFNPEIDAALVARWSRDTEYHRLGDNDPAYPQSTKQAKEWLEHDSNSSFSFMIRTLNDDRLIGGVGLWLESWAYGEAWVGIGIGEREYWGNGYGTDAMHLVLRYAFAELNLQRVSLDVFAHNPRALRSYEKAGFRREGLVRGDCHRDGQRWDSVFMGILREEWEAMNN